MSTVGCYTFPSVGDSDSVFSIDAATGTVNWKYRTEPIEQFPKTFYHDFGFLNGPLLIDGDDGAGGTRPLVVDGSKDGTLYAFHPDGTVAWTNPMIAPPAFAGFGLFNGATGFASHTLYSSLFTTSDGSAWPDTNDHLYAFSDLDGSVLWHDQIRPSWGSMAVANGLLFVGNNATPTDPAEYYVYDATTGARLKTFAVPANTSAVASGASILNGTVYVGYGVFGGPGGVMALGLP
jgi:outer membrane protein assembly factor BamB